MRASAVPMDLAPVATLQPAIGSSGAPVAPVAAPPTEPSSIFRDVFGGVLQTGAAVLAARVQQIASDEIGRHAAQPDFIDHAYRVPAGAPSLSTDGAEFKLFGMKAWQLGALAIAAALVLYLVLRK